MRLSLNWLKSYIDTECTINEIAQKLTSIGLEVEGVVDPVAIFNNFKIVTIIEAEKHPNADKLQVCKAQDADNNIYNIVCGAKNARVGLKTLLALPGARIPAWNETLKSSKIRGIPSEGMLCSYSEISIENSFDGIIEFDNTISLTSNIGDILGFDGGTLDIAITPNRGDCFSVRGIARDLIAAGIGKAIEQPSFFVPSEFEFSMKINHMECESCLEYSKALGFRIIRDVKNAKSPKWLVNRLNIAGINSISLIVDIANFVMLDIGRPLHIYDLNKIDGKLSIRLANMNESFKDLKGKTYSLKPDMLVASDDKDVLCVLGVIGSEKIACDENTTDILIESALFDSISIAKTGTYMNVISDARMRFERGIDKQSCKPGLEHVTAMIIKECGGHASEIFMLGNDSYTPSNIYLTKHKLRSVSGCNIDFNVAINILQKLGIKNLNVDENGALFEIPSWRSDITIEQGLISEILRILGNSSIQCEQISTDAVGYDKLLNEKRTIVAMKRILVAHGMSEVLTYSFMKNEYSEIFKEDKRLIHVLNPINADLSVMRPSLISNLLENAILSLRFSQNNIAIFEEGNVFYDIASQEQHISGLRAGNACGRNWIHGERKVDVFDIKLDALLILECCGIKSKDITIVNKAASYYHPSKSGTIFVDNINIGYFGELHPKINKLFSISEPLVCFELKLKPILKSSKKRKNYIKKIFPKINRDFAFVFDEHKTIGDITNAIYKLDPVITAVNIFDSFNVGFGKKSIGIAVTLDAIDRTLTEDEASVISDKIIKYVENNGGELRKK